MTIGLLMVAVVVLFIWVLDLRNSVRGLELGAGFTPFWVEIQPIWYEILSEHGYMDGERWKEVWKTGDQSFHSDLNVTLLSPKLFYCNHSHQLSSELPRISLDAVWRVEWMKNPDYFAKRDANIGVSSLPFGPKFVVRERNDRWEFSLITDESWAAEAVRAGGYNNHEATLIPLATLPKEVFSDYYGSSLSDKEEERLEKLVEQAGWKWNRENPEWLLELEHKYISITYNSI